MNLHQVLKPIANYITMVHCRDQLLQVNPTNILEAKFGSIIETTEIQIARDSNHASLNWLRRVKPHSP